MRTTFQIILGCVILFGASASFATAPAEYCTTGWVTAPYPAFVDGVLNLGGKVEAVAYCGSDKLPRYRSTAAFLISEKTYVKLRYELFKKMAADNLVEVLDLGDDSGVFIGNSDTLKPGESLCYLISDTSLKCTPEAQVSIELNEKYTDATMVRNSYSKVAPSLYRK